MRILELAQAGKTMKQIASKLGVGESTLYAWSASKPDFREALAASRSVADELVEIAMFQRAVGYRHPAVKIHFDKESGKFMTYRYTEIYPPDTTAGQFWLKNRKPKKWKDVQKVEHDVGTNLAEALRKGRERVDKDKG